MDWSALAAGTLLWAAPPRAYLEALRLATLERLRIARDDTGILPVMLAEVAQWAPTNAGGAATLPSVIHGYVTGFFADSDYWLDRSQPDPAGNRYAYFLTESTALAAIGDGSRVAAPSNYRALTPQWLVQTYKLLNLLRAHVTIGASLSNGGAKGEASEAAFTAAAWGASSLMPTAYRRGSPLFMFRARRQLDFSVTVQGTPPKCDAAILAPVATASIGGAQYDAQGTGYVQDAWNAVYSAAGTTATSFSAFVNNDDAPPPNDAGNSVYYGWRIRNNTSDPSFPYTSHDAAASSPKTILVRDFDRADGFAFLD